MPMIAELAQTGSVNLVTKLSRNPAAINTGTNPIVIFSPFFAPFLKDSSLENVPGKRRLLPMTNPAAPAMTMAEISKVP